MNELKVFDERELLGREFRMYGTKENPLFLAKDVANWIGHSNVTDMISRVDSEEVTKLNLGGKKGECNFLTEDGLYEVLMQSRKPIAKQFKKEVKNILKKIRKTGGYVGNDDLFINTYLPFADDTTKLLFRNTLEVINKQNTMIQTQKNTIVEQDTLINTVINDDKLFSIGTVGKILKPYNSIFGAKNIFNFMRNWGIIMNKPNTQNHNLPYDKYNKHFEIKCVKGYDDTYFKTYFTSSGLIWFLKKLVNDGYINESQKCDAENKLNN